MKDTELSQDSPSGVSLDAEREALLRLTYAPGLGPVLIRRLVECFGSASAALRASPAQLTRVRGVGDTMARRIVDGLRDDSDMQEELELAGRLGVRIVTAIDADYPPLLRQLRDAPPVLYVRGELDAAQDRHCVAMVGSRACTSYGVEQAERFAATLAQAGLTIVSGGARGIDGAAHRGAIRIGGRTVVVMGCGLAHCYPPEHAELFDKVVEAGGAVISELPLSTHPAAENFPARNRIISGMSLGVLVIEAGRASGALITARAAAEEQGREVMAVPGRIDSQASEGSLELLKAGAAAMVTSPADVLEILETPARHLHRGSHGDRYLPDAGADGLFDGEPTSAAEVKPGIDESALLRTLSVSQRTLYECLVEPKSLDDVARETGLDPGALRADATMLELRQVIVRTGGRLARRRSGAAPGSGGNGPSKKE